MDTRRIKEAIADLKAQAAKHEADAAKCRLAVESLIAVLGGDDEELFGGGVPKVTPHRVHRVRTAPQSTLRTAIDILSANKKPMHIKVQ